MKKDIHPQVYTDTVVTCACGNTFTTISTQKTINLEICSACHPFFTGQQKFVDTEGRIDKFAKKMKLAEEKKAVAQTIKKTKKDQKATGSISGAVSMKDMLAQARKETQEESQPQE